MRCTQIRLISYVASVRQGDTDADGREVLSIGTFNSRFSDFFENKPARIRKTNKCFSITVRVRCRRVERFSRVGIPTTVKTRTTDRHVEYTYAVLYRCTFSINRVLRVNFRASSARSFRSRADCTHAAHV